MKKTLLTLTVSTLLLGACSKKDDAVTMTVPTQQETVKKVNALQKSGSGIQGSWSFCHDKKLTEENVVENCNLYDVFLWQFDRDSITVGKVVEPLTTVDCTTQCYSAQLANVQVNNVANGRYTQEADGILVDITDTTDLINFPKCQVKWNKINEVDEQHQQWQLENINCTTAIYDFKTWVKKVN
jgi:PBP1b-binding outer membrane lipoprotein LpoB